MPLIESEPKGKKSTIRFEIDSESKQTLLFYCEFSQNKRPDPVIAGALKLLYKTDPDFGPWLEQRKRQVASPPQPVTSPRTTNPPTKTDTDGKKQQ